MNLAIWEIVKEILSPFDLRESNFDLQILSSSIITRILWNVLFAVELLFNGPSLATHLQDPKAHEMSKTKGN